MSETVQDQATDQCRLCGALVALEDSHIIPKFVFQWLKETSATDHIRSARQINVPKQDGLKLPFLGRCCEDRLSRLESPFAGNFFIPYNDDPTKQLPYPAWMAKFCVSVAWRVLAFRMERPGSRDGLSPDVLRHIELALESWKLFLLDQTTSIHPYDVHLIPLQPVGVFLSPEGPPPDLNHFLLRAIDMDLIRDSQSAHICCKMGPLVLLGSVLDPAPHELADSQIDLASGVFIPGSISLPPWLPEYFAERSRKLSAVENSMSARQKAKIAEKQQRNRTRTLSSQTYRAMLHDSALRDSSDDSEENS